jgi:C4-dicarboxylate transporter DctM subunit
MAAGVNSFPMLAIPFFMIAGSLMEVGGISKRVVAFASALVGHIKGGLSAVSIVGCMFFAALSGSTPATVAAVGSLTIPEMEKRGYDKSYAAAVVAAAGCLGVIIPPSITMVVFGTTANASVGRMLIGGIIPGIFLGCLLLFMNFIMSHRYDYPTEKRATFREVAHSFLDSFPALLMPIIILGGIMTGVFTPTESAAIAVVYGFIIGFFYYKELTVDKLFPIFYKASLNSAMIMLLIGTASPFGWLMTANQVPQIIANFILSISDSPAVIYALILVIYLILGCFMETAAIILLVVPILTPIVNYLGIDLVQFGVVTVVALAIGMATPPVGISLFASCAIAGITMSEIIRKALPFVLILIFGLFVLAYIPEMVLFLPNLLMGK